MDKRVAVCIPTLNAGDQLPRLLGSLAMQRGAAFDVFVTDSSSKDDTVKYALEAGADVEVIDARDFSHGGTRQQMADKCKDHDFVVFMTQDAYLDDESAIRNILAPFDVADVGAVCGRQLPHVDAGIFEAHARLFNYPEESRVSSLSDSEQLGLRAAFISNSFAAYRQSALRQVGGFPSHVILAEDMFVAAKMLNSGLKVAYASTAKCRHSHSYTFMQEFRRYFDTGVFHSREKWIRESLGNVGGEGRRFVMSELRHIGLSRAYLWPEALLRTAVKLLGFRAGLAEQSLPASLKLRLGMHSAYWLPAKNEASDPT